MPISQTMEWLHFLADCSSGGRKHFTLATVIRNGLYICYLPLYTGITYLNRQPSIELLYRYAAFGHAVLWLGKRAVYLRSMGAVFKFAKVIRNCAFRD